jgi:membrane-associated phospholipid phosphatase
MKILITLLLLLSLNLHAQQPDSLKSRTDTISETFNPQKIKVYIIPTVFITYGLVSLGDNPIRKLDLSTKAELTEDHPLFAAHADDYLKFAPLVAMYGLDLVGLKGKNPVLDQTAMVLMTTVITTTVVTDLKKWTHRLRPNGSGYSSFPSGHTATAFAAAELLNQEFKNETPWIGYAGYAVAAATGILRMYNNVHWVSDVVAGAGFGILSTKLTYLIYPQIKKLLGKGKKNLNITPTFQQGQLNYRVSYKF